MQKALACSQEISCFSSCCLNFIGQFYPLPSSRSAPVKFCFTLLSWNIVIIHSLHNRTVLANFLGLFFLLFLDGDRKEFALLSLVATQLANERGKKILTLGSSSYNSSTSFSFFSFQLLFFIVFSRVEVKNFFTYFSGVELFVP